MHKNSLNVKYLWALASRQYTVCELMYSDSSNLDKNTHFDPLFFMIPILIKGQNWVKAATFVCEVV